jgi:hypothetical protein
MFSLVLQTQILGQYSRERFQNLADHSFSCLFLNVSGVLVKSGVDLFLPLGQSFLEAFLYLGPPLLPSFILFREPSTKAQAHQCLDSLVVESLRETQYNIIFAAIQSTQDDA